MKKAQIIFTDVDGTNYYLNEKGDIVFVDGRLVPLAAEDNVRGFLKKTKADPYAFDTTYRM